MSVGYLFSAVLGHLPLLAVLIAGFVLVAARRDRLGPRSVLFARLGLGILVATSLLQISWSMLLPVLFSRLDYSATRYGLLSSGIGLVLALISAAGTGLLIAALVTRPGPASPGGPRAAATWSGGPRGAGPWSRGPDADGPPPGDPYAGGPRDFAARPPGDPGDRPGGPSPTA